jgi:hypothetical protein
VAQRHQALQGSLGTIERHVAHPPASLRSGAAGNHLIIMKQRSVEQQDVRR